jgi:predicted O-linked N-acetylglucosamine transferase (SPINDLY family)
MDAAALFDSGMRAYEAGQYADAERWFVETLRADPLHVDAHQRLGMVAYRTGRREMAVEWLRASLRLKPDFVEVHNNLAVILAELGRTDEAVAEYREAIRLRPDFVGACVNLGHCLMAAGRWAEAHDAYRHAVAIRPNNADACSGAGLSLLSQGKRDEAAQWFQHALAIQPDHVAAAFNLGLAFTQLGRREEAAAAYQTAIRTKPDYVEAQLNLAVLLKDTGRLTDAAMCLEQAVRYRPDYAEAHNNLGVVRADQFRPKDAIVHYREAIRLRPDFAEAHCNLGNALKDLGQMSAALASYRRAVELQPGDARFHGNLVFSLQYCPEFDAEAIAAEHRRWYERHAAPLARFMQPHANDRSPERRLRVGYVSPDFRDHPVGRLIRPLLEAHDPEQVEVVCYSMVQAPDTVTERCRARAAAWHDVVHVGDDDLAELIRNERIDILVDLALHTSGNRLLVFARKPAPVQVTYAGYPGTTGLPTIDYRLTDPYLDPPETNDALYAERSVRLPNSFWCCEPLEAEPAVNELPALTSGHVTFGSLNNFSKVNASVLGVWARVLNAVPGSRLLMLVPDGDNRQFALDVLGREAIAAERVSFVGTQRRRPYLETYRQLDIGLDTFPYNGHTTSLDSFWMGVPLVTLVGQTVVSRGGLSLLTNVGLAKLAATSADGFVRIAVALANDLPRLAELRRTLRERMASSPLVDVPRLARDLETAYRRMWREWCDTHEGT